MHKLSTPHQFFLTLLIPMKKQMETFFNKFICNNANHNFLLLLLECISWYSTSYFVGESFIFNWVFHSPNVLRSSIMSPKFVPKLSLHLRYYLIDCSPLPSLLVFSRLIIKVAYNLFWFIMFGCGKGERSWSRSCNHFLEQRSKWVF